MRKNLFRTLAFSFIAISCLGFFVGNVHAEGEEAAEAADTATGTSIRLSPANFTVKLPPSSIIEDSFEIKNEGDSDIKVEVFASPYSYSYSDEEDQYKLGFTNETNFTQMSRWMTFEDQSGAYTKRPTYTIKANDTYNVKFHIETPADMSGGGQYAVIFTHALTGVTYANGIRTEASPGIVVYGHATEGESVTAATISNLKIEKGITENEVTRNNIYATAKVKNDGNIDFVAVGKLDVEPILGFTSYQDERGAKVSVIPETEMSVVNEWKDTPSFGIYKAIWTVEAAGKTETMERVFFLFSPIALIGVIILLTFITIWIIMIIRKRNKRRSRLAV